MSTRDLKHPWKPSMWIIWIAAIVLGSWLLQGIRICVKEPYFTIFCGKLCRIGLDHAEPGEKQAPSFFPRPLLTYTSLGRALQGSGVAKLSGFGSSGAFFGTRCAFAFSRIPLIFGGETSEVPLPWGLL